MCIRDSPYIQRFNRKIVVVKYGGSAMLDDELKKNVIKDVVLLKLVGFKPIIAVSYTHLDVYKRQVLGVLKNGVNNIVSSTVSITMGLLTTAMNVSIGFVFALSLIHI